MTVIAAVSLLDGVMLMADSRVTVSRRGRRPYFCDIAQKIMPVTANLALAFSGDVRAAGMLMPALLRHARLRRRHDTVSLLQWLPRFMKETYRRMQAKPRDGRPYGEVQFIVAGVIPDRTNVVERARVGELVRRAVSPESVSPRNWMPDSVMQILLRPAEENRVPIPGAPAVVLGVMRSPHFKLNFVDPLACVAIGSGHGAAVEMERAADWILTNGSDLGVKMGLESAVQDFVAQNDIDSVGGMYPCVKIDRRGLAFLGGSHKFPLYELALNADATTGGWVQRNLTTGKSQRLLWPWEIMRSLPTSSMRFDDYREAVEHFNPLRGKRSV